MGSRRRLLFAVVILGLVGCRRSAPRSLVRSNEPRPELVLEHMVVQSYSSTGLDWQLTSPIGKVFAQRNVTRVNDMRTQLYQEGQPTTHISSDQAFMRTGDAPMRGNGTSDEAEMPKVALAPGDMYLSGNVVVSSTDSSKLYTDWMIYDKRNDLIASTAPVRIVRPDSITDGIGMRAKPDLSNVQVFKQTLIIPDDENTTSK